MGEAIDLGIEGLTDYNEIGRGGFAVVYSARQASFNRTVAVKVLGALDEAGTRRFAREQLSMGAVESHPNIVTPFNSGFTRPDGKPYLMMEYLAGGSLQDRLDRGSTSDPGEAIDLMLPITSALGHSHRSGVIHKDVKPANILISREGVAKLSDFGIAAIHEATATAAVAYSLSYTPPETFDHADGLDVRDERSDLYSLAATLYALVTGQPPFTNDANASPAAHIARIVNQAIAPTGQRELDEFFARAMAKHPGDRYPSADDFADALRRAHPDGGPVREPLDRTEPALDITPRALSASHDERTGPSPAAVRPDADPTVPAQVAHAGDDVVTELAGPRTPPRADRRRSRALVGTVVAVALALGAAGVRLAFSGTDADDTPGDDAASIEERDTASTATSAAATDAPNVSTTNASATDGRPADEVPPDTGADTASAFEPDPSCPPQQGAESRRTTFDAAPPMCIDPNGTYLASMTTNLGVIEWEMDASLAPLTVNNFVVLARHRYYDGTTIHRVVEDFVVQGGDANGDPPGTGSPGYRLAEEPPTSSYTIGSVAMAKTAEPNTTGSQFFIVTGTAGTTLPLEYSRLGVVTSGLETALQMNVVETDEVDSPLQPIVIESVVITER